MVINFCDSRVVLGAVFGTQNTGDSSEKFGYSTEEDEFWRAGTSGLHPACVEEDGLLSQFLRRGGYIRA